MENVDREIELLSEWGRLSHGYSKAFRKDFYEKDIPERLLWLEKIVKEARVEQRYLTSKETELKSEEPKVEPKKSLTDLIGEFKW